MRKRLGIVALVVALALTIAVPAALARGAPHAMFRGSVWVESMGEGSARGLDHIVFNVVEGLDGKPDTGHVVWRSSARPPAVHHADIVFAWFTGRSPCDRLWLGDPEDDEDGLCALAMGSYSGPIDEVDTLFIVVCKETPYGGADSIVLVLMGDGYYVEHEFGVESGNYSIHLPAGMFWADIAVDPWEDDSPLDFDRIVLHAREVRGNKPDTGYFVAKSAGSDEFHHQVDLGWVMTTGTTPCPQEIPLGDPDGFYGLCAFAMGSYHGPIEGVHTLGTLLCKENPEFENADTISVLLLGGPLHGEYWFEVVGGNFHILVGH